MIPSRVINPDPWPSPAYKDSEVEVPSDGSPISMEDGALKVDQVDGSVVIDFNPDLSEGDDGKEFYGNLAKKLGPDELSSIASDLLEGIERDEHSRQEWMTTRTRGITLLGMKLEDPASGTSDATAPVEGTSRVHHPLLLEATVRFQATARAELLPSTGPVKVRNDATVPPAGVPSVGHNGGPPLADEKDDLAAALEKDMNHYLTVTAKEYVPDTDRMLFYVGFGGDGFKKVFNCPLRRRPVSESVDAEDLIISNSATALANCGRVTHRIKMRKSVLKRMQIIGAYLDVDLALPTPSTPTQVDKKKEELQGQGTPMRPEDQDYEILETYCELDLDQFAPKNLKGEGLPLPFRVTLERSSRKVLSIIRNWDEDDEQALPKQFFVQFPFIRGLGFYGVGFIHLLGNTTVALTALWRELIDAGMFANFPGFIYLKQLGRQLTNQFRVPPGGGVPVEAPPNTSIRDAIMPVPYKEPGPAFTAFVQHIEEVGARLAMSADIQVGEGKQDAPVGTTLALIEQATKIIDSAHKRLHAAQAEEFHLLKKRFKEDPESFWRHRKTTVQWRKDQFLKALEDYDLVPVADPNNPTSLHRIAKAAALKELQMKSPQLYNAEAIDRRIMRIVGLDPEGLFNATPTPSPPDPRMVAIQAKAEASKMQVQLGLQQEQIKGMIEQARAQSQDKERMSREKIAEMKQRLEETRIVLEHLRANKEADAEKTNREQEIYADQMKHAQELEAGHVKHIREIHADRLAHQEKLETEEKLAKLKMQAQNSQEGKSDGDE